MVKRREDRKPQSAKTKTVAHYEQNAREGDKKKDDKTSKTIQDREKAYAAARARIFGTEEKTEVKPSGVQSTTHHALGPDGTIGFTSRRDQAANICNDTILEPKPSMHIVPTLEEKNESKVSWKNREQDMYDPDFARNYDIYKPTFTPYRVIDQRSHVSEHPMYSTSYDAHASAVPRPHLMYHQADMRYHPPPPTNYYYENRSQQKSRAQGGPGYSSNEDGHRNVDGAGSVDLLENKSYNEDFPPLG